MKKTDLKKYYFTSEMGFILNGASNRIFNLAGVDFEQGLLIDQSRNSWPLSWVEKLVMLDGSDLLKIEKVKKVPLGSVQ